MFLSLLKTGEKELFLDLCMHAANVDEIFAESEQEIIQAYCQEMGIEAPKSRKEESIDKIIEELNAHSDLRSKKIILLELLGLMLADENYDTKEEEFMFQLTNKLGINVNTLEIISQKLTTYLNLCAELGELVLK